jgi:hypothetical protein
LVASGITSLQVIRQDVNSVLPDQVVRGLDLSGISGDTLAGTDYELPWQYKFSYVLVGKDAAGNVTTVTATGGPFSLTQAASIPTVAFPYNGAYLRDPNLPGNTQPIWISSYQPYKLNVRATRADILGAQFPAFTMDVIQGRESSFKFIIDSTNVYGGVPVTFADWMALIRGGPTLLLQSTLQPDIYTDMYFVITAVNVEAMAPLKSPTRPLGYPNYELANTVLEVTLSYVEVDRPGTSDQAAVGGSTWQGVNIRYTTWQDVTNSNPSWLALLNSGLS